MTDISPGKPFSAWEWTLAFRYLRNKRKNGGVGLIAWVAFVAIALAIMGEVYDVAPGARHYGPGGPYAHFAGRDASRAFVTGDFSGPDLSDDVSDFTQDQLAALATWRDFYAGHASYVRVGYLAGGRFFAAPAAGGGSGAGGASTFPRPTAARARCPG